MTDAAKSFKFGFVIMALCLTCAGAWLTAGTAAARQDAPPLRGKSRECRGLTGCVPNRSRLTQN